MNLLTLDKWQEALLINGWTMSVSRGIFKLHIIWERQIGKKVYKYFEDDICARLICKKHKVK